MEKHSSWAPLQQQQFAIKMRLTSMMSAISEREDQESEKSGVDSFFSKYKSASLIEAYPNSFQELSKSEIIKEHRSALYCGNASDLWQYFKFNLKLQFKKLHPADLRILRIILNFVQNYFLEKAIERIPKSPLKERLREKTKHFTVTFLDNSEEREIFTDLLKDRIENKSEYYEFLRKLKGLNFCIQNIQAIAQSLFNDQGGETALKLYESTIDFILTKRRESSLIQQPSPEEMKRNAYIKLMALHLKFTLRNQHWRLIALSKAINPQMQIYNLSKPNGANTMVYFYRDAPLKTLQKQLQIFQQVFQ